MVIKLKNQQLTIDQLKNGKITKNILSDTEIAVIDLVNKWVTNQEFFQVKTSGSTGKPQTVSLPRAILEHSARTSMQKLDSNGDFKSTCLCINPTHIGGIMVVIRAVTHNLNLTVVEPAANPTEGLTEVFDLVSMVPLQLQTLLDHHPDRLSMFKTVLIGGAPLPEKYQFMLKNHSESTCYQTYGMTETASHIALKNLTSGELSFKTLGDVQIDLDDRECLRIKGTVTGNQWIQTNDAVEVLNENQFLWKGRADFVINTGGIKVHPELMETRLSRQLSRPFFIGGIPDKRFGERVVLFVEGTKELPAIDFSEFNKYERPKEIIFVPQFIYTNSGKINRLKTIQQNT